MVSGVESITIMARREAKRVLASAGSGVTSVSDDLVHLTFEYLPGSMLRIPREHRGERRTSTWVALGLLPIVPVLHSRLPGTAGHR